MLESRLKIWAGIISLIVTNTVTLATAIMAYNRPEKEETAKAAYVELSKAVSTMSKENVELHNDIANIRGYLAGLAAQGALANGRFSTADSDKQEDSADEDFPEEISRVGSGGGGVLPPPTSAHKKSMSMPPKLHAQPAQYQLPSLDALKEPTD